MGGRQQGSEPEVLTTRLQPNPKKRRLSFEISTIDSTPEPAAENHSNPQSSEVKPSSSSQGESGWKVKITTALGMRQSTSQQHAAEPARLLKKIESLEKAREKDRQEYKDLDAAFDTLYDDYDAQGCKLHQRENQITMLQRTNDELKAKLEHVRHEIRINRQHFNQAISKYKSDLTRSNEKAAGLEKKVAAAEEALSKAYTVAVSSFASDVSRDLPDDTVRSEINSFFHGEFFSWCADMCVPAIEDQDLVAQVMHSAGLINNSQAYLGGPPPLTFDMSLPDGSSPLVLLQASLSRLLCDSFLTNPFFLSKRSRVLKAFLDQDIAQGGAAAAIDWRIQTVARLEASSPLNRELLVTQVKRFEDACGFLVQELDQQSRDDLIKLLEDFARLALKLWKIRTDITVSGMSIFENVPFYIGANFMDGDPAAVSSMGRKLNGRPIGVVMRPAIMSSPVVSEGESAPEVIWSKALVWVSPKELESPVQPSTQDLPAHHNQGHEEQAVKTEMQDVKTEIPSMSEPTSQGPLIGESERREAEEQKLKVEEAKSRELEADEMKTEECTGEGRIKEELSDDMDLVDTPMTG